MLRTHLIRPRFRYVPVLAEKAAHVAARRAHAEDACPRQKMIQRLLFDGVYLQRCRRAIAEAIEFSVLIDAYETKPCLPGPDMAMPRTEVAVDFPRRFSLPPLGFVQLLCLLEDLQLFHGPSSQTVL